MTQTDAVFQAIMFVEDNLLGPVDVAAMADAAAYSLYYFCRIFGKVTRHTPHDYLIRRRITQAAATVVGTQQKIVDIAFEHQFASHEGFTRAFGRVFGVAPNEARERGYVPALRCLPPLTYRHLVCLQTHHYLVPEIVTAMPAQQSPCDGAAWQRIEVPVQPCLETQDNSEESRYARFTLADDGTDDLTLVLEWILHTWLFYAPYRLSAPHVLIWRDADLPEARPRVVYVPVRKTSHDCS